MLIFPNIDPVLVHIGPLAIHWYGVMYLVAFASALWLGNRRAAAAGFTKEQVSDLIFIGAVGAVLGGRMGYIFFYQFEAFVAQPTILLRVWEGGMSFHGAMIGVILGTYLFSKKIKINSFFFLDIIACVAPLGIFFGRIANFINGELYGKPSNFFWSVIFPKIDMVPRHPSQLYEAVLEGAILFSILIIVILKKDIKIGLCSSIFMILYGVFRIFAEHFREPDIQIGYLFNLFSMGSILSAIMILTGIFILVKIKNNEIYK